MRVPYIGNQKSLAIIFYAMAVGGVGDFGDHYVISDPLSFEVTEDDIATFNPFNAPPLIELINPGSNTVTTPTASLTLGSFTNEADENYSKVTGITMTTLVTVIRTARGLSLWWGW